MSGGGSGTPRSTRDLICNAGAGAAAGSIAATFVCPLDVIKTRLQVHGLPSGQRGGSIIITSLQDIMRSEGFRGMYRGLSPTIVALLPNWAGTMVINSHLGNIWLLLLELGHLLPLQQILCGLLRQDSKHRE